MNLNDMNLEYCAIPGPEGVPEVKVHIYAPKDQSEPGPGLLHIHGGGFVVGNLETEHFDIAALAQALRITAVSVDCRLAPEHPFPAAMEDCYAALLWMHENAASMNIDTDRLGVCGSSASGTETLAVMPQTQVHTLQGELRSFNVSNASGYSVERAFCPSCGLPVYDKPERCPELIMAPTGGGFPAGGVTGATSGDPCS